MKDTSTAAEIPTLSADQWQDDGVVYDGEWFNPTDPFIERVEPLEFIVDGFAALGMITVLGGSSGSGKSMLTQYLFSNHDNDILTVSPISKAIYLTGADASETEVRRRAKSIRVNHGLRTVKMPDDVLCTATNDEFMDKITQEVLNHKFTAIIFDTIADFHEGSTYEADLVNKTMAKFRKMAERTNAAIILITHTKKGSKMKERYDVEDIADSRIWVTKADFIFALKSEYQQGDNLTELQCLKSRSPRPLSDIRMMSKYTQQNGFSISKSDQYFKSELEGISKQQKKDRLIQACHKEKALGKTHREIAGKLGIGVGTVSKYLEIDIQEWREINE